MIFRRFPYTTLNDLNLDWIIKQVKQIAAALQGKQDKPELPGVSGQVLGLDENLDPVWLDNGGGGGGTTNYNSLSNKPQINGVTLSGNKTAADLGLANASDIPTVPTGSLALPLMDGEARAGTNLSRFAMEGHVHPTDTSRASAEELARFSKPNLLDNWYFIGGGSQLGYGVFPVNQRGQTSYSNPNAYTIDRWKLTSGSLAVVSGGITLNGTITQTLPASIGLPVVASALLSDGTMITPSYNDSAKTFTLTATGQTIVAVKLEIGTAQTLAHQENGVWVLNELPDYATELAQCRMYFERIFAQYAHIGSGFCNGSTVAYIWGSCSPKRQMLFPANISFNGTMYIWTPGKIGNDATPCTTFNGGYCSPNGAFQFAFSGSGFNAGESCGAQIRDTSTYIDISAE